MPRNHRRVAEIMQAGLPVNRPTGDATMDRAMKAIDEAGVAAQARFLERSDRQRRATVEACMATPRLLFSLPFFRLCAAPPLSADDAVAMAMGEFSRQREKARCRHWSFDPNRMAAAHDAALIARFFRRNGRRIWQKDAA